MTIKELMKEVQLCDPDSVIVVLPKVGCDQSYYVDAVIKFVNNNVIAIVPK